MKQSLGVGTLLHSVYTELIEGRAMAPCSYATRGGVLSPGSQSL